MADYELFDAEDKQDGKRVRSGGGYGVPVDDAGVRRLMDTVRWSRRRLNPMCKARMRALRNYVGAHFGDGDSKERRPINLIKMATNVYTRLLGAKAPQAMVTTEHTHLKPTAACMELDLNHVIKEIDLYRTLRLLIMEGLFGLGIVKIGVNVEAEVEIGGYLHDSGQPFVDVVSPDDWVQDMSVDCWEQSAYFGNRYSVPLEWARDFSLFDKSARDRLVKTEASCRWGLDHFTQERASSITRGQEGVVDGNLIDRVELIDLWFPMENVKMTMPVTGKGKSDILQQSEWEGPERGMFIPLSFFEVPGNPISLPPISDWLDLDDICNRLLRKLGSQAERQKTVTGVKGNAADDAERVQQSADGEMVTMNDPGAVKEYRYGGVDQQNLSFMIYLHGLFKEMAGNLDSLGGLGAQTDTVGQDELIAQSASQVVKEMQDRTVQVVGEIMESIAFWEFTDPLLNRTLYMPIPGYEEVKIPVRFSHDLIEGDFLDYNFTIHPFSMQAKSPQEKLQTISMTWERYIMPFAELLQQQGIQPNVQGFLRQVAKYSAMTELEELLIYEEPPKSPGPGAIGAPGGTRSGGGVSRSHRVYERISRPGSTQKGQREQFMQALASGNTEKGMEGLFNRG